jgi:multiple sugar transport system substrate-binding protein
VRRLLQAAAVAGCFAVSIGAAACGGGSAGAQDEVRFLLFGEPEELRAYRTLVSAFERGQDDVSVQLLEASDRDDLLTRLSTSFAGGIPPDVFLINYRFYGQFASRGVLEPLEQRVERSEAFEPDDFYSVALDAFRWDGVLTCLPQNVSSLVVYYNADLFRKYSVPAPRANWTWNEMLLAAQRLTLDANGNAIAAGDPDAGGRAAEVYGLGVEPTLIRIAPFVWSNGGELVDDPETPTRFTLDSRESLAALKQFLELRQAYGVVPSDVEVEAEDDESRFQNGRLAMLLSSRRSTPTFRTITAFEWDVGPLPVHLRPAGILHSDAYCMTKASDRKDAAWRFIEFANSPAGQRIVARTGRTVPSLVEVSRSTAFLDRSKPPGSSRVFLDAIEHIRMVPPISTWPEIEDAAEGILENGLYQRRPAEEVAREVDRATRPLFARAQG